MLHNTISSFLQYCTNSNFSKRSIETLTLRLNEFNNFLLENSISTVDRISYQHLMQFIADYGTKSPHVKKAKVWSMHQFFHYLKLKQFIPNNIAAKLPYPKIEKKIAQFLTETEFIHVLDYFIKQKNEHALRDLVMIMLMGFLGLRTAAIIALDKSDVDLDESRLWIQEKGSQGMTKKPIPLPQPLCIILAEYLKTLDVNQQPLFLSRKNKRYSPRSLQFLFKNIADQLGIEKRLHPHLFRHTAATQINKLAGLQVTKCLLGHQSIQNTDHYAHLNPDIYAVHMKNHPYMNFDL